MQLNEKEKFKTESPRPIRIYLTIGFALIVMLSIMIFSFIRANRLTTFYTTLIDASMEVKLHSATAHLWLEELLHGDDTVNEEKVKNHFIKSLAYANSMLYGADIDGELFYPLESESLKLQVKGEIELIKRLKVLIDQRIQNRESSGIGTEVDQLYDSLYNDLIVLTSEIERNIKENMRLDLRRYGFTQYLLIFFSVVMALMVLVNFKWYEGQKNKDVESLNNINIDLETAFSKIELQNWAKTGIAEFSERIRGDQKVSLLSKNILTFLCEYIDCQAGTLYTVSDDGKGLDLSASYAYESRFVRRKYIELGDGLLGESARDKKVVFVKNIPDDYLNISSSLGTSKPKSIIIIPFIFNGELNGVMEFASLGVFTNKKKELLNTISDSIGIVLNSACNRRKLEELLKKTQEQSEELQAQQEEMETVNEELEEKTSYLEEQSAKIIKQNYELEETRDHLEKNTMELLNSNKYKSEFLANMSHELRTPLNSMLLLSKNFSLNKTKNLTVDQIESANIIYDSGNDLLELINDILDLSKIEAGKMIVSIDDINIIDLIDALKVNFEPVTSTKNLNLKVSFEEGLPKVIFSDTQKLKQILKNLISNAVKFTDKGSIEITVGKPDNSFEFFNKNIARNDLIYISIKDTGIGIREDNISEVFNAFHQADGTTSRKFGGTGLGLSISKELANLLGGEIHVKSDLGSGSTFTLIVSSSLINEASTSDMSCSKDIDIVDKKSVKTCECSGEMLTDSSKNIILVIENGKDLVDILSRFCKGNNCKCIHMSNASEGISFAKEHIPEAIILDMSLPDMNGKAVLKELRNDKRTCDIPIHILSSSDFDAGDIKKDTVNYIKKPITLETLKGSFEKIENVIERDIKELLLVEDDKKLQISIKKLLEGYSVNVTAVELGHDALSNLLGKDFDCMILDLNLPDISGFEVLKKMAKECSRYKPPIIVYTGRDLIKEEEMELIKYADSIIIKGSRSKERLIDETKMFLHKVFAKGQDFNNELVSANFDGGSVFKDKTVIVVDDDMRSLFAISKILEGLGMNVLKASNGRNAIDILLTKELSVDIILMDIMMPVMDGYETISSIKKNIDLADIPIIALTAKAMVGDREKCIERGADDYLAKPVDINKLISLIKIWLYK